MNLLDGMAWRLTNLLSSFIIGHRTETSADFGAVNWRPCWPGPSTSCLRMFED